MNVCTIESDVDENERPFENDKPFDGTFVTVDKTGFSDDNMIETESSHSDRAINVLGYKDWKMLDKGKYFELYYQDKGPYVIDPTQLNREEVLKVV